MDDRALADLFNRQHGVIARRQAMECGADENDVRRLLRRKEWVRVYSGVYVNHTGALTWHQRAWAAVLHCEPAALCRASARRAADGPGRAEYDDGAPIQVAIDPSRTLAQRPGIKIYRLSGLEHRVLWNTSPPRQRPEEAVIDLASNAVRQIDAIAHLADAVAARITTAQRLRAALDDRGRVPRRRLLSQIISDIGEGTCSALEHGYLSRVERPHGLPTAHRQLKESLNGPLYRDVSYDDFGVLIELDGHLYHSSTYARDADLERDLDAFTTGRVTARLGWGQVFDRSCSTAWKVGAALNRRGWTGQLTRCPRCPARPLDVAWRSPGDSHATSRPLRDSA
ncbi:hypothetical protein EK0264_03390 [Epidermidibacterium keratini]|uniref:AbiEi antitoxin N-terminal domain-containing protein n=1 Tax=Epidermidibacterium keratini TaxID=1891644 RepID=A0A7L4YKR7_9ACTN|nr:type IV toxin-antitoxin system AbiEi family antitoxin domain-containing protein [Epidermidibacterium keratini]QHB99418.1 hypothetical protein EK0264_03390 [Epidermidibacterium keratini]